MANRYEIIKYNPSLKEEVLKLHTHSWSSDLSLNVAYLEWKYERNPYLKEPIIFLATSEGKVVGMRGAFATKWQMGKAGQTFLALYVDDLVIDPEHRNGGLFREIMTALLSYMSETGFDYALNLSAGPVTMLSSMAMGWKSVGSMGPLVLKNVSPAAIAITNLREIFGKTPLLWRFKESRLLYSRKEHRPFFKLDCLKPGEQIAVEKHPQPEAMADLVTRINYDGRLRQVRDVEYFKWRFQNPMWDYRFVFFRKGARLLGYLVLHADPLHLSGGKIVLVDWEAESLDIKSQLLQVVVHRGQFLELFSWSATLPLAEKALLREFGFVPTEQSGEEKYKNCLLLKSIQDPMPCHDWVIAGQKLLNLESWDIRLIYSMHG